MRETRQKYNPEGMVDRYIDLYEMLNDGMKLGAGERTRKAAFDLDTTDHGNLLQFALGWNTVGHA